MTNYPILELIIAAAIVLGTLFAIAVIRLIIKKADCHTLKPPLELKLYYDSNSECFELALQRLINSGAVRQYDVNITVVDLEKTNDSLMWLKRLEKKLGCSIDIL